MNHMTDDEVIRAHELAKTRLKQRKARVEQVEHEIAELKKHLPDLDKDVEEYEELCLQYDREKTKRGIR